MKLEIKVTPRFKKVIEKSTLGAERRHYQAWRHNALEAKIYIATLFAMCKGFCPKCEKPMFLTFENIKSPRRATLDHAIPLSVTLKHQKLGLTILCWECNYAKGAKLELPESKGFNFMEVARTKS